MNKILGLMLMLMVAASVQAQDDENDRDNERDRGRRSSRHYVNVEFGLNNFLTPSGQFPDGNNEQYTLKPVGSYSFGLSTMNRSQIGGPIFVDWGLNLTWYRYSFQDPKTRIAKGADMVEFTVDPNNYTDYRRSLLRTTYVNAFLVPMIITEPRDDESFRFGAGIYAGYRLGSKSKTVYDTEKKQKDKVKSNFYLNNFQYGIRAQVGWRSVDLFATYNMSTMFQENRGPELYPFGFGIIF